MIAAALHAMENPLADVRKISVLIDEVLTEAGREDGDPVRRVAVMAAVRNPLVGSFTEDLQPMMDVGGEVGSLMSARMLEQFGGDPHSIESYGKAALVGTAGEIEHGFALITRPFARSVRGAFGDATAWMASNVKRGGIGARIDVPLAHKKAVFVRSHYDTIECAMPDAPRDDEIVVILAGANRGRLHARIGGLAKEDIVNGDVYEDRD
jgi:hypothetical protein